MRILSGSAGKSAGKLGKSQERGAFFAMKPQAKVGSQVARHLAEQGSPATPGAVHLLELQLPPRSRAECPNDDIHLGSLRTTPQPSMRFCVKPHSGILAFFLSKRGPAALAIGHLAVASLLLLSWHSFSPAALPSPAAGGERRGEKECRASAASIFARLVSGESHLVGRRLLRPERYARTTVYPCGAPHERQHPIPCTLTAYGTPIAESTHRTNGALAGHPAAERRLSPTRLAHNEHACCPRVRFGLGGLAHTATACFA
jgi:hypothetical protein